MTEYRRNVSSDTGEEKTFNLVNVSIEISHAINRATDCVRETLQKMVDEDPAVLEQYMPLVKEFLPEELVNIGWNVFTERVPEKYVVNLVSTILACELVYNEGIDYVAGINDDNVLTDVAINYIAEKGKVRSLTEKVKKGEAISADEARIVARLLELGGPRAALTAGGIDRL